jgi:DNA ligase-1
MLANASHSLEQVEHFVTNTEGSGRPFEAVAGWKYDGMRCQAHWDGQTTKLFSRHLLDTTEQYPDTIEYLSEALHPKVASFIIGAEIVGVASTGESAHFPGSIYASRHKARHQTISIGRKLW